MANTSSIRDVGEGDGSAVGEVLQGLIAGLQGLMAGFEPGDVPVSRSVEVFGQFVTLQHLAEAGRVLMIKRVAQSNAPKHAGLSAAELAANESGLPVGRSRDDLELAERLGRCGGTDAALRRGELSAEQAGAIAGAASVNPGAEEELLERARRKESLRRLKEEAERRRHEGEDAAERQRRAHRSRSARSWTKDGVWHFHATGPLVAGGTIDQALGRLVREHYVGASTPPEQRESREAYAFDALADLVRAAMRGDLVVPADGLGDAGVADGTSGASTDGNVDAVATRRTERPDRLMLIRVDLAALARGSVGVGELCEIAGLGPIPVEQARALMGECILKAVLTDGVAVANITSLRRTPTVAQDIALLWSQPHCAVEGCDRVVGMERDHQVPWSARRETRLDNLARACERHHDLKTLHGWDYVEGVFPPVLVGPTDPRHPANQPADDQVHAPGAPSVDEPRLFADTG